MKQRIAEFVSRLVFVSSVFSVFPAGATIAHADHHHSWRRVLIPGAKCGDGSDYPVFVRRGDPSKVALLFEGGGVCWDAFTCFGPLPYTTLHPAATMEFNEGIFSHKHHKSPISHHTAVFLTYCTGDVFTGDYKMNYGIGKPVHHVGYSNVQKTLDYLVDHGTIDPRNAKDILVYGSSAGAVGAAINLRAISSFLPPPGTDEAARQHKTLILDSPGLHWEDWFWLKFPDPFIHALSHGLNEMGIEFSYKVGNLGQYTKHFCDQFPDWSIAYLQATMDLTMSLGFSSIGPFAHRDLVLGPTGLLQVTADPTDRCTAWISESFQHTFLRYDDNARMKAGGLTAMQFARRAISNGSGPNYH